MVSQTSHIETVRKIAEQLGLLHTDGRLKPLDSLGMIDFLVALEESTGVSIPAASLREESFQSIESIVMLLEEFADH